MPNYFYDHVHLVSPDPVKTAAFYERAFHGKKVSASESRAEVLIQGTRILIRSPREGGGTSDEPEKRTGLEHFGLGTDDIEAAVADLKTLGVRFLGDIRVAQPSGVKIAFLMAPDNVMIELVQRT